MCVYIYIYIYICTYRAQSSMLAMQKYMCRSVEQIAKKTLEPAEEEALNKVLTYADVCLSAHVCSCMLEPAEEEALIKMMTYAHVC